MRSFFLLVVFCFFACGCATMNVPGQTSASPRLRADIVNMIRMIENAQAPGCSFSIVNTSLGRKVGDSIVEDWTIESCGKEIVYPVTMTPDPKGGTYFGVTTPTKEERNK